MSTDGPLSSIPSWRSVIIKVPGEVQWPTQKAWILEYSDHQNRHHNSSLARLDAEDDFDDADDFEDVSP